MKKRVLVVDGSCVARVEIERLLVNYGFAIVGYCPDSDAVLLDYGKISPDLVLVYIVMPGRNGLETSAVLHQMYPDSRIVIVSALNYDEVENFAVAIDCKGLCQMPFTREELLSVMRESIK